MDEKQKGSGVVREVIRKYYWLTKPGIIYGNTLPAVAAFLLATHGRMYIGLFLAMLVGMSLVIGSACAFNNYMDRKIDHKMARTKKRALVAGTISGKAGLVFAAILGLIGFSILAQWTNNVTVLVGAVGYVDYIFLYGYFKRHSVHGTLVGSISGAMPPVAGYTAVTGHLDGGALILFLMLVFWQMPHFYAIAMYRLKDYQAAKIPVLPAVKGMKATKIQMIVYTVAFLVASVSLTVFGYAGYMYLIVVLLISLVWLWRGLQGLKAADDVAWAHKMFLFSLIVLLVTCAAISVDSFFNPKAAALRNGCARDLTRSSAPPRAILFS